MTPGRTTRMERSGATGYGMGAGGSGGGVGGGSSSEDRKRFTGETIHSGQFMVSHFEAEGPEDEDDDDLGMQVVVEDVKPAIVDTVISNIISKRLVDSHSQMDTSSASSSSSSSMAAAMMPTSMNAIVPLRPQSASRGGGGIGSAGPSAEMIRYAQKPLQLTSRYNSSQVEIDTDLSKVFNTLNVTYTQKLTSPKWNPFKGIRLRWKEKIRLNNVIWRCWHMQFIMKRRTLVCQFASPLDVDVHNTPQAILLEGKYWKRKCNVIKAEYKKWRRFYVNRALGTTNIVDTTSELDFLEWSPSGNEFMITDNMSADTLLSTLAQYPFPDSREIARGAGRADFIQPSLGPLQPNFDDLMDLDLDFLNFPRLPPVPEEGSEDILKAIEYNYPSGSNQMNSSGSIQEITNAQVALSQQIPSNRPSGGTNSVITGPVTSMSVGQSQQQQQQQQPSPGTIHYSAKVFSQNLNPGGGNANSSVQQQQQQLNNVLGSYLATQIQGQLVSANVPANTNPSEQQPQQIGLLVGTDELGKESKPKFSRAFPKILGREPHNYDKCQPTTHQTMAYNMVSQPNLSQNILQNPYGYQLPQGGIIQMSGTPANQNLLNYNLLQQSQSAGANPMNLSNTGIIGASNLQAMNAKLLTHSQSLPVQQNQQPTLQKPQPRSNSMPVAQNYPPISPPGGIQEPYKGSLHPTQTSSYKSYHNHQPQPYKIPSQTIGGYGGGSRSMRHASPPHGHQVQATAVQQQQQQQQQQQPQQPCLEQSQQQLQDLQLQQQQQHQQTSPQQKRLPPHPTKEMFRSNSLPINATFPLPPKNEENFAVPRLQSAKSPHPAKLRGRSNSMIIKQQQQQQQQQMGGGGISGTNLLPALHSTTSEPVLNVGTSALLAQLLTTTSACTLLNMKQHSSSSSAISSLSSPQQQQSHQSHIAQQPKQQPQMCQQVSLGSPISPTSSQMQLNLSSSQHQQPHSSVLTFATSTSSAGSSGLSSESMALDLDSPMLGIEGNSNSSSGSGVGNKFHQQQARSESQRRSGHIHAEQKRRYNIKNGFDMLHSLIPQLQQNPNAKLSKAAMLQKGAEYIKQLRVERSATNEKMDALRREIDTLNNSLNNLQTALPASGAPVSRQRTGRVKELYQQYVRQRTLDNWKFWIFGLIFEPLMNTFNQTVSVASLDEMCRSSQLWVDQHCSLVELRPVFSRQSVNTS